MTIPIANGRKAFSPLCGTARLTVEPAVGVAPGVCPGFVTACLVTDDMVAIVGGVVLTGPVAVAGGIVVRIGEGAGVRVALAVDEGTTVSVTVSVGEGVGVCLFMGPSLTG